MRSRRSAAAVPPREGRPTEAVPPPCRRVKVARRRPCSRRAAAVPPREGRPTEAVKSDPPRRRLSAASPLSLRSAELAQW